MRNVVCPTVGSRPALQPIASLCQRAFPDQYGGSFQTLLEGTSMDEWQILGLENKKYPRINLK